MSAENINLEPLIERCIPLPKKLSRRTRRLRTIGEVEEYSQVSKLFVDSTDRRYQDQRTKRKERTTTQVKEETHSQESIYGKQSGFDIT